MIKVQQNKTPITIKRLRFRHQRHGWKRTPWLSCIQKLKEKISMVLFVILEVSVHLTKKIVVWKWKKFTETNRNSFRGQLNPLVMNVKEKNEFHSASLWLSLITAINILVIYLKFVCSFHRLCFRSCFRSCIYSATYVRIAENPSLQNRLCMIHASLKSKLTKTVVHCLTANRHHSYVNSSTIRIVNLLCYTTVQKQHVLRAIT